MKVVQIAQGSPEWLAWRMQGIGGSDAPVVLGCSPYRTKYDLFREKARLPRLENDDADKEFIFNRGRQVESVIRQQFFEMTGVMMEPLCGVHEKFDHVIVSLDGFDHKKFGVLEGKLVGAEVLALAKKERKIPDHHFAQIQHAIEASGVDLGQWFGYDFNKKSGVVIEVKRDKEFIKRMLDEEHAFWALVQARTSPPLSPEDYLIPEDTGPLAELREAKERAVNAQDYFDSLKEEIVSKYAPLKHQKFAGAGLKLYQVEREGSLDLKAVPEIQKVLAKLKPEYLDKFRRKGSVSWTVTLDKPKKQAQE